MTRPRLRYAGALILTVALVAACGPVDKQRAVQRIAAAANADAIRTGTITVTTRPLGRLAGLVVGLGAKPLARPPASLRVVVDRTKHRAALLAPPAAAARIGATSGHGFPALALFDHDRVYVRAADGASLGARPWLASDLTQLDAVGVATTDSLSQPRVVGDLMVVTPMEVMDLALGVLTGSVRTNVDAASGMMHYEARTSIEKEFRKRHLDPSDAKPLNDILRALAAKDDINPIEVTLDGHGALRRVAVDLIGRPEYGIRFATTFALDLDAPGGPVDATVFAVPRRGDVVEVTSLGDVRAAVDEWTPAEAAR